MTATTTQTIRFSANTETSLFDGAEPAMLAALDVAASIARFDAVLTDRLQRAFPGAEISADANRANGYWASGFGELQDDIDAGVAAQTIAEDLFEDGNLWMVEA